MIRFRRLLTARDVYPGVKTAQHYRNFQLFVMERIRTHYGEAMDPTRTHYRNDWVQAFVGQGVWRVRCPCDNYPAVEPEWKLACCTDCGAVYQNIVFPDDRHTIEGLLVKRPNMVNRNWLPSETVDTLRAENIEHGIT